MANLPSLDTLKSADDAFAYPLLQVKDIYKQLQISVDERNARLRTLVGGSYRQLLETAEMIVDMKHDFENVESRMAHVAEGCGRSAVNKRVVGLGKLMGSREQRVEGGLSLGLLGKIKALEGCAITVGRLLRDREGSDVGKRLITAAQVLILSRLLVKSVTDELKSAGPGAGDASAMVEQMKRKLGSLRKHLLKRINDVFAFVDGSREVVVEAMCAYSLVSSSGAKEVLRQFLHARGEALALKFESTRGEHVSSGSDEMLTAVKIYTHTLLDVQTLVPRQLSDALLALKGKVLLQSDALAGLELLRLDVLQKWFGDEVLYFAPYIRHDDLDGPQAVDMLRGWSKRALEVLLQGFDKTLSHISDFRTVVDLRTKVLLSWVREGGKAKGFDPSTMLDELRKVLNGHLLRLLESRVSKLHLVGTEVEAVVGTFPSLSGTKTAGLWSSRILGLDVDGGGAIFKTAISSSLHGRSDVVSRVVNGYKTWLHLVEELSANIEELRKQRWNDDLDSLEDDDVLEDRQHLLSKEDPLMLQEHLETSLERAYKDLHQRIATTTNTHLEPEHGGGIAMFILRILREIRQSRPKRPDLDFFGLTIVPALHQQLAAAVTSDHVTLLVDSSAKRNRVPGRALWEGSPELPVQPSPSIFKFLRNLCSDMADAGTDLWSPAAVEVLQLHLREEIGLQWLAVLNSSGNTRFSNASSNADQAKTEEYAQPQSDELSGQPSADEGVAGPEEDETAARENRIQGLFDVLVLQQCFRPRPGGERADDLVHLEEAYVARTKLEGALLSRLRQSAQEYQKRTALLFGILA
jgi:hypothetical protein